MYSKIVETDLGTITQIYEHKVTKKDQLVFLMPLIHCVLNLNCFLRAGELNSLCANQIGKNTSVPVTIMFLNDSL